jgi:hypothetical protein
MLLADLRQLCRDRGVALSGTKAELVERLTAVDVQAVEGGGPLPEVSEPVRAPDVEPQDDGSAGDPPDSGPVLDQSDPLTYFEAEIPAVRPSAVDERWLLKCERRVLRWALSEGKTPCGEVESLGSAKAGKAWRFRVQVRD